MAVALGKRKFQEGDTTDTSEQIPHGSTLFVSNLPYTATSTDLQTLFSDIAPVRSAFVVLDHDSGNSKGVGYVSFAIREDAQMVFDQVEKEGLALVGRKLRVQWAERKKDGLAKEEKSKKPAKTIQAQTRAPHDPLAVRTIVISGLPTSIDSKTLWKKVRKLEGAEKVHWPVEEEKEDTAHVLFTSPSSAHDAVTKLHAHIFKGSLLSVTLKKRLEGLAKPIKQATAKPELAPSRASRLIVRNLPFDATEQDVRALFLPHGPVYSIHMPIDATSEEGEDIKEETEEDAVQASYQNRKKRFAKNKGFAFVWMYSKKDAEKAMEACNGVTVHAGIADEMAKGKQLKKKEMRLEKKAKAASKATGEDVEMGGEKGYAGQRVVAVDWALSKDRWNEEKAKVEQEEEGSEASSQEDEEETDHEEEALGVHDASDDDERSDDGDDVPVKPELPAPAAGTTLFVRNVPFDATEEDLRLLFRAFGPLRYARVTVDSETGRSRGTGFACFWNVEDADKAVAQSELLKTETGLVAPTKEAKKNPFKLPSILTPDPSSSLAQNLVLHGRTLDVVRAVTRDEAGKLKEDGERRREKADKRNLYLLREGAILPNTPAAANLPESALEKRTASFNARRALLRSNPSLYVSKTRLSIRQIPLFVTERMLKQLATRAVSSFEEEVKSGSRQPLSADEQAETDEDKPDKANKKGKGGGGVKQTKIIRLAERVDGLTGKGRSKGYGFVEMRTHSDALRVLRWANNNTDLGPLWTKWWKEELETLVKQAAEKKGKSEDEETRLAKLKEELERMKLGETLGNSKGSLIVEFSIENIQVVQRRSTQQKELKEKRPKPETETAESPKKKRRMSGASTSVKEEKDAALPPKKRRLSDTAALEQKKEEASTKLGTSMGSLIGRKRKQRQSKKK